MKQFIVNNTEAYGQLEQRARSACVRFRSQELPPSCTPNRADIGFEIDGSNGSARLYVDRGIHYSGRIAEVQNWLSTGVKQFQSFDALKAWVQAQLGPAFNSRATSGAIIESEVLDVNELTDVAAVHDAVRDLDRRPMFLDEKAIYDRLSKRVLGQDGAIRALSAVMVRHCARSRPARPAVVFAIGPSGVGKTRTAEMVAQVLSEFNGENSGYHFLRLDMSEYQEPHRVSQLIGAPQGYLGHGEGSQFADALRANPRTIVLFDEIEKAHSSILRLLMNTMDAGRLSTASRSSGVREIDCRNAVFIFTSNLDATEILSELDNSHAYGNRVVEDEVCRRRLHAAGIAPEIVGRIGRFLVFRPLGSETRASVLALSISEVAVEYGLRVAYVEPEVIISLMQKTRSSNFGVRPERYLIDDLLGSAFAKAAEEDISTPVVVAGPPYVCNRLQCSNEDGSHNTLVSSVNK